MEDQPRILVVDDDPDFVKTTQIVLESADYQVSTAYTGQEGLAKARAELPDLIILDIIMPEGDGFMVCEELKRDPALSRIPVMMLTSLSQRLSETTYSVAQGLLLEAEDYVDKPVAPAELLARVKKLLKQ